MKKGTEYSQSMFLIYVDSIDKILDRGSHYEEIHKASGKVYKVDHAALVGSKSFFAVASAGFFWYGGIKEKKRIPAKTKTILQKVPDVVHYQKSKG